jgi:hypothetical protein
MSPANDDFVEVALPLGGKRPWYVTQPAYLVSSVAGLWAGLVLGSYAAPMVRDFMMQRYLSGDGAYITQGLDGIENAMNYMTDLEVQRIIFEYPLMVIGACGTAGAAVGHVAARLFFRRADRRKVESYHDAGIVDASAISERTSIRQRTVERILKSLT